VVVPGEFGNLIMSNAIRSAIEAWADNEVKDVNENN
jgi:hypothetical protein